MDNFNENINMDVENNQYKKKYKRSRMINLVLASVIIGAIIGSSFTFALFKGDSFDITANAEAPNTQNAEKIINESYSDPVVNVADKVLPSIVMIKNIIATPVRYSSPFSIPNSNDSNRAIEAGTGSGIIYSEDGYIITNQHVINGASELLVTLHDGREFKGRVIGQDEKTDLAVIKIEATGLPAASIGDSSKLKVGELAVAIGNPMGEEFSGSVTAGIVSALNRSISIGENNLKLIQTDAAINPGNSGGALVNKNGEVVGINSAKLSAPDVEGMGFAIPINDALPIIKELMTNGYVKRPWIGVGLNNVTDEMSKSYNIPKGVYVVKVYYGSPAEAAGIRAGDIITEINGKEVLDFEDLSEIIEKNNPGDKVELKIYRNAQYKEFQIELGTMPPTE